MAAVGIWTSLLARRMNFRVLGWISLRNLSTVSATTESFTVPFLRKVQPVSLNCYDQWLINFPPYSRRYSFCTSSMDFSSQYHCTYILCAARYRGNSISVMFVQWRHYRVHCKLSWKCLTGSFRHGALFLEMSCISCLMCVLWWINCGHGSISSNTGLIRTKEV
jgi:hypothetical protein